MSSKMLYLLYWA